MNTRIIEKSIFACLIASILSTPQLASANISCAGTVTYLGIGSDGTVTVALSGLTYNNICNVNTQGAFQMNPAACKAAYATLLANEVAGRQAAVFYNDPALTSCGQIAAWSTQNSVYFIAS